MLEFLRLITFDEPRSRVLPADAMIDQASAVGEFVEAVADVFDRLGFAHDRRDGRRR